MDAESASIVIFVETVIGQRLSLRIQSNASVLQLKQCVFELIGVAPYFQGLVFAGQALNDNESSIHRLDIVDGSLLKLMILTRSGPLQLDHNNTADENPIDTTADRYLIYYDIINCVCSLPTVTTMVLENEDNDDDDCIWENVRSVENRRALDKMCQLRRNMNRMKVDRCGDGASSMLTDAAAIRTVTTSTYRYNTQARTMLSAPEDTSAKESSAGDTEFDDDRLPPKAVVTRTGKFHRPPKSISTSLRTTSTPAWLLPDDDDVDRTSVVVARSNSPEDRASDPSELSSGMIICDISNDFRRLRVRQRRHHVLNTTRVSAARGCRTRSRCRLLTDTTVHSSEMSSSDDEHRRRPLAGDLPPSSASSSSARKMMNNQRIAKRLTETVSFPLRMHHRLPSTQSQQRCTACACRLTIASTFQCRCCCRCGKTLCSRHRPSELHMCSSIRQRMTSKMQDVSD